MKRGKKGGFSSLDPDELLIEIEPKEEGDAKAEGEDDAELIRGIESRLEKLRMRLGMVEDEEDDDGEI